MKGSSRRTLGLANATFALGLCAGFAGCSASAPTPMVILVTPAPTPIIIYVTPAPTSTPTDVATPTPQPTVAASATPVAPLSAPTSRAAMCSGNDTNKAFFAEAAAKLSFDVYCAVLPTSWWVQQGKYTLPGGGLLQLTYKNNAGDLIVLLEGAICPTGCAFGGALVGPASFGGVAGSLYLWWGYLVVVGPINTPRYALECPTTASQSQCVAWAAALRRVPGR